jgi:hypothetical protein
MAIEMTYPDENHQIRGRSLKLVIFLLVTITNGLKCDAYVVQEDTGSHMSWRNKVFEENL